MKINEENFLSKLRKKDDKALEYIIDLYGSFVNGIVRKVLMPLNNDGLIEECISDVFLGVWDNIDRFKGDNKNFKSWIGAISKYKAIDYYRKYIKKKCEGEVVESEIASEGVLEDEVIQNIETKKAVNLINELKEPDRSIFIMKFLFGYSSKKISDILNITVSSIDTKISRGRKKLKEKYRESNREGVYE